VIKRDLTLPQTLFPFIWHFLKSYQWTVIVYMVLAILAGFWGPFNSMLMKQVINVLPQMTGPDSDLSALMQPASLIVMNVIVFYNFTWQGIAYIQAQCVPRIINQIIGQLMDHMLGKSHQFYQDNLSGKIAKQITNLSDGVEKLLSSIAASFLRGSSVLCTAIIATYFINPIFCSILIIWFVIFASMSFRMSKKLVVYSDAQAAAESSVIGELVDSLANHSNVRIFSGQSFEHGRMTPFFDAQQQAYTETHSYALWIYSLQGGLIALMLACTTYCLVYLYRQNLVTIGDFALILGLFIETAHMMWFAMLEVDEFNKVVGRCQQSLTAFMIPFEIPETPNAQTLQCSQGHIRFDKVQFFYKGTVPLFQNQSFEIPAGQKVGLVGYSGGGKSTLVHLILRLYDITEGAIYIDGQDLREVTQQSLRENIAMIPQDPSLFHRSLKDNIRYGRMDATDQDVIVAAKKAHAHEFIEKLPQGYDALVGERGMKLSGGQRQRIAIARAILKNAPILILDEATSQLDSMTENIIQESLWNLMNSRFESEGEGKKTVLVIAHRLSTLLHMDRILVLDKGVIIEDGTHAQLLLKKGLYKALWDAQSDGFLPEKAPVTTIESKS